MVNVKNILRESRLNAARCPPAVRQVGGMKADNSNVGTLPGSPALCPPALYHVRFRACR
jgi:hypothetical protein